MHHAPSRAKARARGEAGFGLVELLVVMIILAILASLAISTFGGARSATRNKEAIAAATAYEAAIASWMSDHGNRKPTAAQVDSASGPLKGAGPLNLLGRPYTGGAPSGVAEGRVTVDLRNGAARCTGAPPAATKGTAFITYCPGPATDTSPGYAIRLLTRAPDVPWSKARECWRGTTANAPRCG